MMQTIVQNMNRPVTDSICFLPGRMPGWSSAVPETYSHSMVPGGFEVTS